VTGSQRVYSIPAVRGCPHTHILVGRPAEDCRGTAFISALLAATKPWRQATANKPLSTGQQPVRSVSPNERRHHMTPID